MNLSSGLRCLEKIGNKSQLMTEYAKESKNIQRLRRKIKKRLKEETKTISKRTLKKISQLIHLKLERQKLDSVLTHSVEYARECYVIDVL